MATPAGGVSPNCASRCRNRLTPSQRAAAARTRRRVADRTQSAECRHRERPREQRDDEPGLAVEAFAALVAGVLDVREVERAREPRRALPRGARRTRTSRPVSIGRGAGRAPWRRRSPTWRTPCATDPPATRRARSLRVAPTRRSPFRGRATGPAARTRSAARRGRGARARRSARGRVGTARGGRVRRGRRAWLRLPHSSPCSGSRAGWQPRAVPGPSRAPTFRGPVRAGRGSSRRSATRSTPRTRSRTPRRRRGGRRTRE